MTVIVWDGDLLVSDGRMTVESSLVNDSCDKLFKVAIKGLGNCVGGFAGDYGLIFTWIEHLKEKGLTQFTYEEDDECTALVITNKNECYEIYSSGSWFKSPSKMAIGSGSRIAQHFLLTEHDAIKAAMEACKTELSCGGRITVYDTKAKTFTHIDPLEAPRSAVQADSEAKGSRTAKTTKKAL